MDRPLEIGAHGALFGELVGREVPERRMWVFGGILVLPGPVILVFELGVHCFEMVFEDELGSNVVHFEGVAHDLGKLRHNK